MTNIHEIIIFSNRIPGVSVNDEEGAVELEISDDPNDDKKLSIQRVPVMISCNKVAILHSIMHIACGYSYKSYQID